MEDKNTDNKANPKGKKAPKTRQGSGYLRQLYSTARTTAGTTHSNLKNLTTVLVNFVPTEKVDASELQVRTHFDQEEIDALANSIKRHGVLQPILVVQDGDRYKVIAGERRLRATKQAGIDRIPARVVQQDDKSTHEIALRENLDRVDLHPVEEGEAYQSLLRAGAYKSHDEIAQAFMKKKSRITECIGYTKLPEETKIQLLQTGQKNRSLLRGLMSAPPEEHPVLIEKATGNPDQPLVLKTKPVVTQKKEKDPSAPVLVYKATEKRVSVPQFNWRPGEGKERLGAYVAELKNLLQDLEKLI